MDAYDNMMVEARVAFANQINTLIKAANAKNLGFFLIYYTALSAALQEPMEKILKKASKRCQKMLKEKNLGSLLPRQSAGVSQGESASSPWVAVRAGFYPLGHRPRRRNSIRKQSRSLAAELFNDLADALNAQAHAESKNSRDLKNDVKTWIDWWNQKEGLNLFAKDYLRHPTMPSVQAYHDLHRDIVKHQSPFAELAIACELQRAQTVHSFALIKLVVFKLGFGALRRLGFVRRAAKRDTDRCANKTLLMAFIHQHPETLPVMVKKARAGLLAYADFIEDCFQLAEHEAKKYQLMGVAS